MRSDGVLGLGIDVVGEIQGAVLLTAINEARHWNGIAADPPDPNFLGPAPLGPLPQLQSADRTPFLTALLNLGTFVGVEGAAAEALLASLEKYQGAQAASDGVAGGETGTRAISSNTPV